MKYLSVCSGIEAATVAWHPLAWTPVAFAEIEKFPSAVLAHHYPSVQNLGDMTKFKDWPDVRPDILVGGTPCQSFSVAGLRKGMADPRGNLALTYLAILDRYRPEWCVWENVPGVLSSGNGRDFGSFLGGMAELGYGFAYRVLDAQYVRVDGFERAVPQRRRRVFVVGNSRDWRRAAAVLFERESLSGNIAPSREARERFAGRSAFGIDSDCLDRSGEGASGSAGERSGLGIQLGLSSSLRSKRPNAVAHALRGEGFDASEDGTGRRTPLVPIAFDTTQITSKTNRSNPQPGDACHPLAAGAHPPAIAFDCKASGQNGFGVGDIASTMRAMGHANTHQNGGGHQAVAFAIQERAVCENPNAGPDGAGVRDDEVSYTLEARTVPQAIAMAWAVRRLTPRECERLQGFPDGYTDVPWRNKNWTPDGPRYKSLGNSMAVNAMRWLGRRIEMASALSSPHRGIT